MTNKAVDPRAVKAYATLASKGRKDVVAYVRARVEDLAAGTVTVSVLKASIEAAGKRLDVPVKAGHVPYFGEVLAACDKWEETPVGLIATAVTAAGVGLGKDGILPLMSEHDTFDGFREAAAAAKKAKANGGKGDGSDESGDGNGDGEQAATVAGAVTADDVIRAAVKALQALEDITMEDEQALRVLAALVKTGAAAGRSKKSGN